MSVCFECPEASHGWKGSDTGSGRGEELLISQLLKTGMSEIDKTQNLTPGVL